jgi:hypothetical protein
MTMRMRMRTTKKMTIDCHAEHFLPLCPRPFDPTYVSFAQQLPRSSISHPSDPQNRLASQNSSFLRAGSHFTHQLLGLHPHRQIVQHVLWFSTRALFWMSKYLQGEQFCFNRTVSHALRSALNAFDGEPRKVSTRLCERLVNAVTKFIWD